MKAILQIVQVVALLAVAFPIARSGAQVSAASKGSQAQSKVHAGLVLRSSDVLNAKVFSDQGAELGSIRDVVMDPKTGRISHAVVGSGGWQGLEEQFAIVPWHLVAQDEQRAENYVIDTNTVNFTGAPTFHRNQWATVIQPGYLAKIDKYYASPNPRQASSEQPATPQAFIASKVTQAGQALAKLFQPGQKTTQAQAQPAATPAKQAEEAPRKLLQIEPRPRFSRKDQANAEKKEDKKEKPEEGQSKPATTGALASTKSPRSSSTSVTDSSRKSRQAKATKHRRTSCHASRRASMSSRSSHERDRCKCTKHKG